MVHQRTLALALLICCGCIRLDPFLFSPTVAADDADLMVAATAIPASLQAEQRITTSDGTVVDAYVLTHNDHDGTLLSRHQTTILYCHGNARNIAQFALRTQALWQLGYNVVVFDYRGFGKTRGTPSESGVYDDARAVRSYITSNLSTPERTALYGYSLGGAVCSQMAVEQATPALIVESTFASVNELIQDGEDLAVPRPWYADAQMNTRGKIPQHQGAFLVVHGADDTYIQPRYGEEISAAAAGHASPNELYLVPGANHDTAPCQVTTEVSVTPGACVGGFGTVYLEKVSALIDGAIAPVGTD